MLSLERCKTMDENKIKEYDMLREEIMQKIELHNNLLIFTITTCVAILSFAFSQNNAFLYLIPFCVVIPMSLRIAYYLSAMVKLSSYMIVFLEEGDCGYNWETLNKAFTNNRITQKKNGIFDFTVQRYYEFIILSLVCYILYIINYVQNNQFDILMALNLLWPMLLVIFEAYITKRLNSFDKEKNEKVQEWQKLKEKLINQSNNSDSLTE